MSAPLTAIPVRQRRRLAMVLAVFAVLFAVIGGLTVSDARSAGLIVIAVVAFVVAAFLGLVAWGVAASVKDDAVERRLDDAVQAALATHGSALACSCGHDHDPDELHVVDAAEAPAPGPADDCGHDGHGADNAACTHDCATCLLAARRS